VYPFEGVLAKAYYLMIVQFSYTAVQVASSQIIVLLLLGVWHLRIALSSEMDGWVDRWMG